MAHSSQLSEVKISEETLGYGEISQPMKVSNTDWRTYLLVFTHTLLLMWATYHWLNIPYTYQDEGVIISWSSIIKNIALGLEHKPPKENFLLINTSYEKALLPKVDEYGFEIGSEAITDRQSLADFFRRASLYNHHQFIVCDIFLETASPYDSSLLANVQSARNVRFPYHRQNGEFIKPVIPVPAAFSDYDSDFGNFLKYSFLQYDTCRTIALDMYQTLDNGLYEKSLWGYKKGNRLALNSFIIEFPIRQYDIFRDDTLGYNCMHLNNFLALPDSLSAEMLKNKIVVLGDFLESDMHQTIYGITAGPLIHLDAYLNLKQNRNDLSFWFFLYLFAFYSVFSYVLFFNSKVFSFGWTIKLKSSRWGGFLFDYLKYAFFLLLMSVFSFLLFDVHLNVLIISMYFSLVEYSIEFVDYRKKLKANHP